MNPTQQIKEAIEDMTPLQKEALLHQFIGLLDHASTEEAAAQWAIAQLTYLANSCNRSKAP